jgi:hypothetical protein
VPDLPADNDDPALGVLATLPQELHYLIQPALTYGVYQFDEDIDRFLKTVSDDDLRTLYELGQTVSENGHYAAVNEFLSQITPWSPEAANLYFLFGVMDALDVKFW